MHLFELWFCKPKLEIELCSHHDFEIKAKDESAYTIYYVCETEVNSANEPFAEIAKLYGEVRPAILYPCHGSSKKFFLIAPTQSEPKKLDIAINGSQHISNHFGALLAHATLGLPISKTSDAIFYVTLSNKMKELMQAAPQDFAVGLMQRSLSTRIRKNKNLSPFSNTNGIKSGLRTMIFRDDLFSENDLTDAKKISECMAVTRSLINMPANVLNPETYVDCVKFLVKQHNKIAKEHGGMHIEMEIIDEDHLETLGCELICAVGQGSTIPPRLVKLTAHPDDDFKSPKKIALVGKGITYDTGGYGLKPAAYMRNMKKDMGGSAATLGTFLACAKLNIPVHITCYLALAENMISGNAMRPGDIYKAYNGIHVEIDHTDAEGRLVLADALSLASEQNPDWIIDVATLTGAARVALGPSVDSVFGNRLEYNQLLQKIGLETGDWVWNLPLPAQYNTFFDSKIADIMNSTATPHAGAITAALFLQRFVGTCAWNHIDSYMWCERPYGMWGEDNAPTAKCVRLLVSAIEKFNANSY